MKATDWQAIIFDFDGVLVESVDIKTQAFAGLYQSYGETIVGKVVRYHSLMVACHATKNFDISNNIFWKCHR